MLRAGTIFKVVREPSLTELFVEGIGIVFSVIHFQKGGGTWHIFSVEYTRHSTFLAMLRGGGMYDSSLDR